MKIIFIRHGESEMNIFSIKSCSIDKHLLTPKGEKGVKKVREALDDKIDIIYCSPMLRTRKTVEILNDKIKIKAIYDKSIMEYDWGKWDGKTKGELIKSSKSYKKYMILNDEERFTYKFGENKEGESRAEVVKRVKKFLKKIEKKHSNKTVLIISHSGINAAIHRILRKISVKEYFKEEGLEHNAIQYFILDEKGKLISYKKRLV